MTNSKLANVEDAVAAIKAGRFVIVVDDEDRENEGDLVMAAEFMTPEAMNFLVTHGRGLVCLAMQGALLDRLNIPMMVPSSRNSSGFGTPFTVSVEATNGVSTGISAADRSHTVKTLINPQSRPSDIAMPGHIFPLRANDNGVLARRGQTEASVDLAKLAHLTPAGVICEVMAEDGEMMRLDALLEFGSQHDILVTSVELIAQYRMKHENASTTAETNTDRTISFIGKSSLPTVHGVFDMSVYRDEQGREHSLLVMGEPDRNVPIVRMHSECLTGDAFGSIRCDCGEQLQAAMAMIAEHGTGVLVYLRQEGRGIGLGNKIRAYELQDSGMDTVDANHQLGFPADARVYDTAAAMLKSIDVITIRLLTNNPDKVAALQSLGITISEKLALEVDVHEQNAHYLTTKAERMGHSLSKTANKPRPATG